MKKSLLTLTAAIAIAVCGMTSCKSEDGPTIGGSTELCRLDLSGAESLTIIGTPQRSRAVDGELTETGLYKIDADGNISTVGLFVNQDGKEIQSTISVNPDMLINATEDFLFLYSCHYLDKDGDEISRDEAGLPNSLLVHKADGRIYNADDLPWYVVGSETAYLGDGNTTMYAYGRNYNHIIKITINGDECTWQQITPDNSPIKIEWKPKLFKMNSGAVAVASPVYSLLTDGVSFSPSSLAILYPKGGYDWFNEGSFIPLSEGFIKFGGVEPLYVSVGNDYGQLTETTISCERNYLGNVFSWYDMGEKALLKTGLVKKGEMKYYLFDRTDMTLSLTDIDFDDIDYIDLWNENLYNGRLYGLVGYDGHYTEIAWINPETLEYGTIDLDLASDIDVTNVIPDYSHGKMQMTGTRRSNGYNIAIDLDLTTGHYTTMFSDPNRQIVNLVPLN